MKPKRLNKNLILSKQTITHLGKVEMKAADGGIPYCVTGQLPTCVSYQGWTCFTYGTCGDGLCC